jgi:hypothetical protein
MPTARSIGQRSVEVEMCSGGQIVAELPFDSPAISNTIQTCGRDGAHPLTAMHLDV